MVDLVRRMEWTPSASGEHEQLLTREWLVTNGIGGYASGTIAGVATRRYHGLLIAALPAPWGRTLLLSHLTEEVRLPDGRVIRFGGEEEVGRLNAHGADLLSEFRLELGMPVWQYAFDGIVLEKAINLPHGQNTVHVIYRLVSGTGPVRLSLKPLIHFRSHEDPVSCPLPEPFRIEVVADRYAISTRSELPPLRMMLDGCHAAFTLEAARFPERLYRLEQQRGYEATGDLWSPGHFDVELVEDRDATLIASTEDWDMMQALKPQDALQFERDRRHKLLLGAPAAAQGGMAAELVLAADQFLIEPRGRTEDKAWARATGDEFRTIIAGYHWFTEWGRDTMISLEGLTLATGRHSEAGYILRTFGHYIRDGLIPNLFPEGGREGLYHTADATLWFFHAIARYIDVSGDTTTLDLLLPKLVDIVEHHLRGTRYGIGIDASDGLLRQGAEGYQLTWMDAKVGDWVVTPRHGKAVELNALWYNALCLLQRWLQQSGDGQRADQMREHAERNRRAFNERFWFAAGNHLYDVVDGPDGDDAALRPNQIFAISLEHPVLEPSRWPAVLDAVRNELLTPCGLRTLSPRHPGYKPIYFGDLPARDAAYHQGTVWPWLIGHYLDAYLKVRPDDAAGARSALEGFQAHLGEACIGSISEIFDADAPFHPRGCIAQAWSVAEVLRLLVRLGT
jgi:predicted glycogen debranching enzyme